MTTSRENVIAFCVGGTACSILFSCIAIIVAYHYGTKEVPARPSKSVDSAKVVHEMAQKERQRLSTSTRVEQEEEDPHVIYTQEIDRLSDKLIEDIDQIIKDEYLAGRPIDYLLKEKRGFADYGVIPILPRLQPAVQKWEKGLRAAKEKLNKSHSSR